MDQMDDTSFSDRSNADGSNGTASVEPNTSTEAGGDATSLGLSMRPTFLSELAHAMQSAAGRERERIASAVTDDAAKHVEKVRSRASIESEELRRRAEDDVARIEEWSAAEVERVKAEAAQRVDDRRGSLDGHLKQHDAIIETEIEGVDTAVRDYGLTLDRFFEGLAESSDPSEIVRLAEMIPPPPNLDDVRASGRASAMALFAEPASAAPVGARASDDGEVGAPSGDEPSTEAEADGASAEAIETSADWGEAYAGWSESSEEGSGSDATPVAAETTDVVGSAEAEGAGEAVGVPDAPRAVEGENDQPVGVGNAPEAAQGESGEPVGVMDPSASDGPAWPVADERLAVGQTVDQQTVDHTSAAVRLLRSVAPWTAPTHAGDHRPPSDSD